MAGSLNNLSGLSTFFKIFVETGTYRGETISKAAAVFKTCYTIELSEEIFCETKNRLSKLVNVSFILGDSAQQIKILSSIIDQPAVFFLDAHYAGGKTAFGSTEVPLYDELESISQRPYGDLVIVDDFRLFGQSGISGSEGSDVYPLMQFDWRSINYDRCLEIMSKEKRVIDYLVYDDRLYILKLPSSGFQSDACFPTNIKTLRINHVGLGPLIGMFFQRLRFLSFLKLVVLSFTPKWIIIRYRKLRDRKKPRKA